MYSVPVVAFAGFSGSGKTTLIEKLIVNLKARGLRVAVIKHDRHQIDIDREGKDSWRFSQAGADISIVSSSEKTALIEQRELSFQQAAAMVHDVDLILVEGYKEEPLSQIGVCRKETGKGFPAELSRYVAVVSNLDDLQTTVPRFEFENVRGLSDFIIKNLDGFTHLNI